MKSISIQELHAHLPALGKNELILDVRSPEEFADAHISGSANMDVDQVAAHAAALVSKLSRFERVYIHCRMGGRAQRAAAALEAAGLKNLVCVADGGMHHWTTQGWPVVTGTQGATSL